MAAVKNRTRPASGSVRVSRKSFKALVKTCENAPRAGKTLREFVHKGQSLVTSPK